MSKLHKSGKSGWNICLRERELSEEIIKHFKGGSFWEQLTWSERVGQRP